MRRIALRTRPAALFGAMLVLALVALLPMRAVLGWAGVGDQGLAARQVTGSVWAGRLTEARLAGAGVGDMALGDLDAGVSFPALLIGRLRLRLDSAGDAADRTLHGTVGVDRHGWSLSGMSATLPPGRLFAPLPVTALTLDEVDIAFRDGACDHATGRVRATLASGAAGVVLPPMVSGPARCEGAALLLPLASAAGTERVTLRLSGDGRYTAVLLLQPQDPAAIARLQTLGFAPAAGGYALSVEGRLARP